MTNEPAGPTGDGGYLAGYEQGLRLRFGLEPLGPFTIIVEGLTDVQYLTIATEKVGDAIGFDLLDATASGRDGARISLCTPLNVSHPDPAERRKGGSQLLGRLVRFLRRYDALLEVEARVCFVVDHDSAGRGTLKAIGDTGFDVEYLAMTIDPAHHPGCCSHPDAVIEDLLSLRVQQSFFDRGGSCCRVTFIDGEPRRFEWDGVSKGELPEFVRGTAGLQDVSEIVRVLLRVRQLWGWPNPDLPEFSATRL